MCRDVCCPDATYTIKCTHRFQSVIFKS
uniref:Uncharacterized protein n=1 Tax=Arundo donax TaxID=35708 RepID=A0A0A9AN65_ARUDO